MPAYVCSRALVEFLISLTAFQELHDVRFGIHILPFLVWFQ